MTAVPAEAGDGARGNRAIAGRAPGNGNGPVQRAKAFLTTMTWNPIVAKELRSRMRGWHAFALLTAYTCVIGALGWLVYDTDISSAGNAVGLSATGAQVFRVLAAAVMATVALIVPGLVGPAISGERERQTLDLLLVTPLRSSTIVVGKLFAALYFVIFLVVACVPLFCVAFLLGGVSLSEVVEAVIFTLVGAFTLGSISMLASVMLRQVSASTVVSYLAMLVLAVGPVAGGYALNRALDQPAQNGPAPFNIAQASTTSGVVEALSPAVGAASLLDASDCGVVTPFFGSGIAVPVSMVCGPGGQYVFDLGPLGTWQIWEAGLVLDGAIAIAALGGSVWVLDKRRLG
jgi:ABC-type transport system involved in multi-copper enzyme maturation permease subunit